MAVSRSGAVDEGLRPRVGNAFEFDRLLLLSSVENEGPRANLDALGTVKASESHVSSPPNKCRSALVGHVLVLVRYQEIPSGLAESSGHWS